MNLSLMNIYRMMLPCVKNKSLIINNETT